MIGASTHGPLVLLRRGFHEQALEAQPLRPLAFSVDSYCIMEGKHRHKR
jgi:hypothetical protein